MISLSFSLYVTSSFWRGDLPTPCCGGNIIFLLGVGLVFAAAAAEAEAEVRSRTSILTSTSTLHQHKHDIPTNYRHWLKTSTSRSTPLFIVQRAAFVVLHSGIGIC